MVENDSKNSIFHRTLETIIFNEKDFEELKLVINKLGNGNSHIQQLKKKIINSRIRMLREVSDFLSFHLRQQPNPSKEDLSAVFRREIAKKDKFLTLLGEKIENIYQNLISEPNSNEQIPIETEIHNGKVYVIDGANICGIDKDSEGKPMLTNLSLLLNLLESKGIGQHYIKIFCDASLRHHINNPVEYEDLVERKIIIESPAGIKADEFIIDYCIKHNNAYFISDDLMREYKNRFPSNDWLKRKRLTVMKVDNEMYLRPMDEDFAF